MTTSLTDRRRLLLVPLKGDPVVDLPADVTIVHDATDWPRMARSLVLVCPRFDPVEPGAEAPRITLDELHAL